MEIVHILWAIANVALIILVIRFWLSNFEFYSDRYGRWPGYVLLLISVAMCSRPGVERQPANSQSVQLASLDLPDTLAFPTNAPMLYDAGIYRIWGSWGGHISPGKKVVRFTTYQLGLVLGVNWQPGQALINLTLDNHLSYTIPGTMRWSLFGFPLYSDARVFQGEQVLESEPHRPGVNVRTQVVPE